MAAQVFQHNNPWELLSPACAAGGSNSTGSFKRHLWKGHKGQWYPVFLLPKHFSNLQLFSAQGISSTQCV